MRAAQRDAFGGPDVVVVRDVPDPAAPVGDHVLIRVHTASVNRADLDILYPRWPILRPMLGMRRPRNPALGSDAAGVVEAVGPDVTSVKVGDRVVADLYPTGLGAFAELALAPERWVRRIPGALSFDDAATLPHSAILAFQGLRGRGGRAVKRGDRVLIAGASGNVGPFAVQLAKGRGATVTGLASGPKLDFVRAVGADDAIDYRTTDISRSGRRFDWILDVDGNLSLFQASRILARGGIYATLGGNGKRILAALLLGPLLTVASGRRLGLMLGWKPFAPDDIAKVLELVASGTVKPAIDRRYPLDQAADALRWVDDGHARGKVLVTVRPSD